MQAYVDPDQSATLDDWAFALAFAQDQSKYGFPVAPMQPCRNSDCANSSYALFCSEACRIVLEGQEETETAYYSDGEGVLLGHRQLSDAQRAIDGENLAALACGYGPAVAAPAVAAPVAQMLPEAPAAISVKLAIAGYADCILTLRDSSETRLLDRLETLLQRFQPPVVQSPPVQAHGDGFCQTHQVQMKLNPAKPGQGKDWYSHKHEGHWCRGKAA